MAWNPFAKKVVEAKQQTPIRSTLVGTKNPFSVLAAGLPDIVQDSETLLRNTNYDYTNEFDLYDEMLKLDPELNGAVRTIALTANKYKVVGGRNSAIRSAITELVEEVLDFDDFLINAMRNLMIYGNDINKYIGRSKTGITGLQSLPISQMTLLDSRPPNTMTDKKNAIITAEKYVLREQDRDMQEFPASEVMHIRIDYRSHWFRDRLGRWTYGVWGASRFSSLKQAIRAKYNSINNRIALEDSLTKQFITIGKEAIEGITDPAEANARLNHVMQEVADTLDGLRSDQMPILPHYVNMQFVDLKNTVPDNSAFLDNVNADISAVLHVPRVSMGQERGSTFAATFNANQWSVQAIRRLQQVLVQAVRQLFSKHLELLGIPHKMSDLPVLEFDPMDEESKFEVTRRAVLAYEAGITTLNEAREDLGLTNEKGEAGKQRYVKQNSGSNMGEMPRQNENKSQGMDNNELE